MCGSKYNNVRMIISLKNMLKLFLCDYYYDDQSHSTKFSYIIKYILYENSYIKDEMDDILS